MLELQPDQSLVSHKRALAMSAFGLFFTIILAVGFFVCDMQVPNVGTEATSWILIVLACSWLYPLLELYLETRVDREAIDIEYLKSQSSQGNLFDDADDYSAAARLKLVKFWLVPIFALCMGVLSLVLSFYVWHLKTDKNIIIDQNSLVITGFIQAFIGFILFIFARFLAGLASQSGYGILRSPAGLMMLSAWAALLSAIARAGNYMNWPIGSVALGYICAVVLGLYALETLGGVVLHIYSNQKQTRRPPQDSRLLFILASPSRIAKSIGDVLDYQFGFEISKSTMYRAFEKGIAPFLIAQIIILWLCSSITIIDAGYVGFVERFGKRVSKIPLEAGLHFNLPWPIDSIRKVNVGKVYAMQLGLLNEKQEIRIWTTEHGQAEESMVVASAESVGDEVPVNLLATSFALIYKIRPNRAVVWAYNYANAKDLFESRAKAALTRYLTTVDFFKVMGEGRRKEAKRLTTKLEAIANSMGVDLAYAGFVGVHPPVEVAESYEAVVKADEAKRARLLQAESTKNKLSTSAGYEAKVIELNAQGQAAGIVALAKGDAGRFGSQLIGYKEAPKLYKIRRRLEMLKVAMTKSRKYIVPEGKDRVDILNLEEKLRADITDLDLNSLAN